MAACFLTRKDYPNYIAKLAKASPDRWREMALLAGAKSSSGGPFAVWALADELCFKSPDKSDLNPEDIWGSYLACQVLAESANLKNVSERNSQTLQRIKTWLLKLMGGDTLRAYVKFRGSEFHTRNARFRQPQEQRWALALRCSCNCQDQKRTRKLVSIQSVWKSSGYICKLVRSNGIL